MNSNFSKLYVRIHSKLAAGCPIAIKMWYFCRALSNNGKAQFRIAEVANLFNRSTRTVRSWLQWGLIEGFYRQVTHDNKGNYTVYYSSLFKLTKDWGHVTEIDVSELLSIREIGIQIEAQGQQKKARCAAIYNRKESLDVNPYQRKVRRSEAYLGEDVTPSKLKGMGVLGFTSRYMLMDSNSTIYGTTHQSIALFLERGQSTVYRALKNVKKIQFAQTKNEFYAEKVIQEEEKSTDSGFFYCKVELPRYKKRINKNSKYNRKSRISKTLLFKSFNSLYLEDRVLLPMRTAKLRNGSL